LRFHGQHGHVFQGRYKSPVIQDDAHLARVCDYIHLNPVRAGVVTAERLQQFASSSLSAWLAGSAPTWLRPAVVLEAAGCANQSKPWLDYSAYLVAIAREDSNDDRMVRGAFSRDWAIGTAAWRKALAREHAHLALARTFAIGGEGAAVGAVGASAAIGAPGKRSITSGTGVGAEERALEESFGAQTPRCGRPFLPLARRETVHGQAGFRLRIRARRATKSGGQGLAIHGLTQGLPRDNPLRNVVFAG
jgi:hypothetical protein